VPVFNIRQDDKAVISAHSAAQEAITGDAPAAVSTSAEYPAETKFVIICTSACLPRSRERPEAASCSMRAASNAPSLSRSYLTLQPRFLIKGEKMVCGPRTRSDGKGVGYGHGYVFLRFSDGESDIRARGYVGGDGRG